MTCWGYFGVFVELELKVYLRPAQLSPTEVGLLKGVAWWGGGGNSNIKCLGLVR